VSDSAYQKRSFLSSDEQQTAMVRAHVSVVVGNGFDAQLRLSDCTHAIDLDFDVYDDAEDAQTVIKDARRFKRIITQFCDQVIANCQQVIEEASE
jgi:hypothetical protein